MYIQFNKKKGKNGKVYKSVLICEKYRENRVIKTRVIMNISKLPNDIITSLKAAINAPKGKLIDSESILIKRTFDYGYAFVILKLMDKLRISETLHKSYRGNVNLIKLMIVGKVLTSGSKLEIFNWIKRNEYIAEQLSVDLSQLKKVDQLYHELGELSNLQERVERKWAVYHKPTHKDVFLYDITSTYLEGTQNDLAAFGYNRDGKKGKMQITIGLVTDSNGFPLKIQVFKGNVNDHKTVEEQLLSVREQYKAERIILVGDRGMRIRMNLEEMGTDYNQGIYYISALTNNEISALLKDKVIQLSLFSKELVEVEKDGSRFILSKNPQLEKEKTEQREKLKQLFDEDISILKDLWQKRKDQNGKNLITLKEKPKKKLTTSFSQKKLDSYKYRATSLLKKYGMSKYYEIKISNHEFDILFDEEKYQTKKMLDGRYVIETTVPEKNMNKEEARDEYKKLQNVEHAFRDLKSDLINIRPLYHRNEAQTRGHVFICMFAYAIIKELENYMYPWLKEYNKINKRQLAFKDLIDELKNIKMTEFEFGYEMTQFKYPKLNSIQSELFKLLNLKPQDMIKI